MASFSGTTSSSGNVEIGGSGFSTYSPISTLEQQYSSPAGTRLLLFCRADQNCCFQGGVESILKLKNKNTRSSGGVVSATTTTTTEAITTQEDTTSCISDGLCGGVVSGGDDTAFVDNDDDNPFSFLSGEDGGGCTSASRHSTGTDDSSLPPSSSRESSSHSRGTKNNPMHFFKKAVKTTTQSLERGMTKLSIHLDQGRNPDQLMLGLYDPNNNNSVLTLTESQPLPSSDDPAATDGDGGIIFAIPLQIPGLYDDTTSLTIKLWIRSGAALLQQAKAAKNFLLGTATVTVGDLRSSLNNGLRASYLSLNFESSVLVNGKLSLCVVPDLKFAPPAVYGLGGWSFADPDISSAYSNNRMFNLPLDQSYGMKCLPSATNNSSTSCIAIATERSTESCVVLPIASAVTKLVATAVQISQQHSAATATMLQARRMDAALGQYCDVNVQIISIQMNNNDNNSSVSQQQQPLLSVAWQRPDSILEVELVQPTHIPVAPPPATFGGSFVPGSAFRFFPKACTVGILPSLLREVQSQGRTMPKFWLGNLRIQVVVSSRGGSGGLSNNNGNNPITPINPFDPKGSLSQQQQQQPLPSSSAATAPTDEIWECNISLESLLKQQTQSLTDPNKIWQFILQNPQGQAVATVAMTLTMQMQNGGPVPAQTPARDGLVSLVGLAPIVPSIQPCLDYDADAVSIPTTDPEAQRRHNQLLTMGMFCSHDYLHQHNGTVRESDAQLFKERADAYAKVLSNSTAPSSGEALPSHKDKSPRPFRPSSSRSEVLLSSLPFNVHTTSLSMSVMDPSAAPTSDPVGGVFFNTTCGAPADHARGFGNIFKEGQPSTVGSVSSGLRRLEIKRQEIGATITRLQNELIAAIANHFSQQRQSGRVTPVTHIPSRHALVPTIQRKLYDAVQALHHVTWVCAIRRASVFSQALGIAVTTLLASLSEKWQTTWPALWARHGYLVSFEGLLSAAGNELGMIEDASVGISMLHRVSVVFVRDDGATSPTRTTVPFSPYVKWIDLSTSGQYDQRQFVLKIGIVPPCYEQRIPPALQNGTHVRIYSLLFEVGVDIRQWGANAGSNMMTQFDRGEREASAAPAGLIEDEDDDVGIRDDDVLVQLNYEAFQLLNAYAHLISPANSPQTMVAQRTHPLLEKLYQHIVQSAGKMDHNILDEAATLAQQLGGGGVVFCKSGKDRTAMHVTFKQAQFAYRFRERNAASDGTVVGVNTTLKDAAIMRIYGTRLPICEKNVGQAKYAFNSLQVQFMPEALKPPMNTLAGFLKGGAVFSGGGIES